MNRHERRKAAAQARRAKGSDTMGAGYTHHGPLPERVISSTAYLEGQRIAKGGKPGEISAGYHKAIEDAARLMREWVRAQPTMPDLRWLAEKDDGVFISAGLDVGAAYLADSPAAFGMLAWLDEKMNHQLSLNQARWALRLNRALPMPDGSYHGVETIRESAALRTLRAFAIGEGDESKGAVSAATCGHCGVAMDHLSGEGDVVPGVLAMCIKCFGVSQLDADRRLVALSAEQFAALPDETRGHLDEMKTLMRSARLTRGVERKGPVAEA